MAEFKLPQVAPQPQVAAPAGFRMPMVEGVYVPDPRHMPPEDRARLMAMGWKPGNAIPTNLPQLLAEELPPAVTQLQDAYNAQDPVPPAPAVPIDFTPVPIATLPPARQAEIDKAVASALTAWQQPQAQQPAAVQQPAVQPSRVAAAFATAQRMHEEAKAAPDLGQLNPALAKTLRNTQRVDVVNDVPAAAPGPAQAEAAPPDAPAATGLEPKHVKCARCGFPAGQEDVVKLTESDKLQWLQTLGSDEQFFREFTYYGNRGVRVTLRTLSPDEHDAIVAQVHRDVAEQRYMPADRLNYHERYLCSLMLRQLQIGDNEPTVFPKTLLAYSPDGDKTDLVRRVYEALYITGPLQVLATARLVNQALRDMVSLTHKLEAAAYDPDF